MGGRSKSSFTVEVDANDGSKYINFKGNTVLDGGGFCSIRAKECAPPMDFSSFDGICVSMRSAQNFKYKFYIFDTPQSYSQL